MQRRSLSRFAGLSTLISVPSCATKVIVQQIALFARGSVARAELVSFAFFGCRKFREDVRAHDFPLAIPVSCILEIGNALCARCVQLCNPVSVRPRTNASTAPPVPPPWIPTPSLPRPRPSLSAAALAAYNLHLPSPSSKMSF